MITCIKLCTFPVSVILIEFTVTTAAKTWNWKLCCQVVFQWRSHLYACYIFVVVVSFHTCTCTSTGTLHRVRGLRVRPFSITPPCRQPHSVFGGCLLHIIILMIIIIMCSFMWCFSRWEDTAHSRKANIQYKPTGWKIHTHTHTQHTHTHTHTRARALTHARTHQCLHHHTYTSISGTDWKNVIWERTWRMKGCWMTLLRKGERSKQMVQKIRKTSVQAIACVQREDREWKYQKRSVTGGLVYKSVAVQSGSHERSNWNNCSGENRVRIWACVKSSSTKSVPKT